MTNPYLYSTPWPANATELAAGTPPQLLAVETEPINDPNAAAWREVGAWRRRVGQLERLNETLAAECDRLRKETQ